MAQLHPLLACVTAVCVLSVSSIVAQQATTPAERLQAWTDHVAMRDSSPFAGMQWHAIGPSLQSSRIEAIALEPGNPSTMYVGPGAGNVWKTTNNGITWTPIFEHESAFAIGDIAVAPSDADVVWVGTGEVQPRHSGPAFSGTGVFKSVDAGGSWSHMGLDDTHHIGKLLIHPTTPDVVLVGAMGHFRSANDERGVFRSDDGGKTWSKTLFVSDETGVIDMAMRPGDPDTVLAWAWQLTLTGESGPESGLHRSTDGGSTWTRVTNGLPAGPMGRAGLEFAPGNPDVAYAFVDNWTPTDGPGSRRIVGGELYRSDDAGVTWRKVNTDDLYDVFGIFGWKFADVRVSPADENELYILGNRLFRSQDGGGTFTRIGETIRHVNPTEGEAMHLDHHELLVDPNDPARLILGNDGGVYISHDRGQTWLHLNNIPIGQFYFVAVDDQDPYQIYAGTQDNGALIGDSTYRYDVDPVAADGWRRIWLDRWTGGDAFVTLPDPTDPRFVYYEHQNGAMRRIDTSMGNPYSGGPATENIAPRPAQGEAGARFSWFTPFIISAHAPRTLYAGANVVFRSTNRGQDWRAISGDLSDPFEDSERAMVPTGAITTLAESPLTPGMLYAGTEGGSVHVTENDGRSWRDASLGLPDRWVTRVIASKYEPTTAYVSLSGYRGDDFRPYLFRTDDGGATWTSISVGLPDQPINVVVEDPKQPSVLYVGTDLGVYVSRDRGESWASLVANLPSTPVYDLVVHPREDELIAATHGRSLFLIDVRPVQAVAAGPPTDVVRALPVRPVQLRWRVNREVPPQPPRGTAEIHYWLASGGAATITIRELGGESVRSYSVAGRAGVNVVEWDARDEEGRNAGPGTYEVEITSAGATSTTRVVLLPVAAR